MKLIEISRLAGKKPQTIAMFFSRHNLSLRKTADVQFYLKHLHSGKRLERGLRCAKHLEKHRFQPKLQQIQKARELVQNRKLIWGVAKEAELSEGKIVESVLSHGDWNDLQELFRLIGKKKVAEIFHKQISKPRTNYRPQTLNFFRHYFDAATHAY
jgi:hypothetical protein